MLYFASRAFGIMITIFFKQKNKNNIFIPILLCSFLPLLYIFHPSYLPVVFVLYFSRFFSLPLSHFATSIPHVLDFLSLLIAYFARSFSSPSIQYLFSLSSYPHLNFAIIFLSFILSLPRYSFVIHHPYPCCILDSLILSLLSCLSVSLSLSLSSTFIHLPFALNPSTSSLAYPFLW
jgi:hypothetical protein